MVWSAGMPCGRYRVNTQGFKITEENFLSCYDICKWLDILVFLDKYNKL